MRCKHEERAKIEQKMRMKIMSICRLKPYFLKGQRKFIDTIIVSLLKYRELFGMKACSTRNW
jgi:ferredoxin-thioredoxin reductase catalytic subunit